MTNEPWAVNFTFDTVFDPNDRVNDLYERKSQQNQENHLDSVSTLTAE